MIFKLNIFQNSRTILHDIVDRDNIITESFKKMSLLKNHKENIHFYTKSIMDDSPSDILKLQNRLPYLNQIMHVLLDLGNNGYKNKNNILFFYCYYYYYLRYNAKLDLLL